MFDSSSRLQLTWQSNPAFCLRAKQVALAVLLTLGLQVPVQASSITGPTCVVLEVLARGDTSGPWQQFVFANDDTRFIYIRPNFTGQQNQGPGNQNPSWGTWRLFAGHDGFSHPQGSGDVIGDSLVPHATLGMLVVKINNEVGHWHQMAGGWNEAIRVAPNTNVWLAVNDKLGTYGDNSGAVKMQLCNFDPR